MRDRLDQKTGYCWGFERMCQARTLQPGCVSTTAPLSLGNLVLLGLQSLLWVSLPFSWVMNSVCGLSSFLFIGLGLSSPTGLCSISNSHPGLYFSTNPQPGGYYCYFLQKPNWCTFPHAFAPSAACVEDGLPDKCWLISQNPIQKSLVAWNLCVFAIFISWSPGRADAPISGHSLNSIALLAWHL